MRYDAHQRDRRVQQRVLEQVARERLVVRLGDPHRIQRPRRLAPPVHRRELLQPRRRELERPHGPIEEEGDRLAVLEGVEELDPCAVEARSVREPNRARDCAPLVPPGAADDLGRKRLAHPLQEPVHRVQVVKQAAQEALRERAHDVGVARADCRLDLLGLAASRRSGPEGRRRRGRSRQGRSTVRTRGR